MAYKFKVCGSVACGYIVCGFIACGYIAYRYIVCGYTVCRSVGPVGIPLNNRVIAIRSYNIL